MAGHGNPFDEALKRGSSFAWNEEWEKAAEEYRLALEASPQDSLARSYLAMALYRAGRLSESLEMYQVLWRAEPDNTAALSRITELQEALGDREAASAGHRVLAEFHVRQGAHGEALKLWQRAVQLRPDNLSLWDPLMDAAVQVGEEVSVLPGYLSAANEAAQQGRLEDALRLAERAHGLVPDDPRVVALLSDVRHTHGVVVQPAPAGDEAPREGGESLPEHGESDQQEEEEILPENVVRFVRPAETADGQQDHSPQLISLPVVETAADEPSPPAGLPAGEEDRLTEEGARGECTAPIGQPAAVSPDSDLPVTQLAGEMHVAVPTEAPAEGAVGSRDEEPMPASPSSETTEEAQASGAGQPSEEAEQRPELAPTASEVRERESQAATGEQDQTGALTPQEKPVVRQKNTYGWGAGSIDFGLTDGADDAEPEPPQPDVARGARPKQGKGLIGRVFGFMWQPGEEGQNQAPPHAPSETSADPEAPPQWGSGAIDFGLAEAPEADRKRRDQGHHWGVKDFGLAEASGEGTGTGLAEASADEGSEGASPEAVKPADALPAAPGEVGSGGDGTTRPAGDSPERVGSRPEAAVEADGVAATSGHTPADLVELAEAYLQMGQVERAMEAYNQALDADPDLPGAMVGLARLLLSSGQLDAAQVKTRRALELTLPEPDAATLELLLEILREDPARERLGSVVDAALWIRSSIDVSRLSTALSESLLAMPVELLGRTAGEHLEEVVLLPPGAREDCIASLQAAEEYLRRGQIRSAADEMYRLLSAQPDFLPAQSLLGRVLVAQGRVEEARAQVERLVRLYELKGEEAHALGVLWWAVAQRVVDGDARSRLADLLRRQNRREEAELIELGWVEPSTRSTLTLSSGFGPLAGRGIAVPERKR